MRFQDGLSGSLDKKNLMFGLGRDDLADGRDNNAFKRSRQFAGGNK